MNTLGSLLQNIRWIALGIALTVVLGISLFAVSSRPVAPRLDLSSVTVTSQTLLADDGQETHGGGGKTRG